MAANITIPATGSGTAVPVVSTSEEITSLNGGAIATGEKAQRVILAIRTASGTVVDVTAANPLPTTSTALLFGLR